MALGDNFLGGMQQATQQAVDDARRMEIQQKALAAYGGVANQGQVNPMNLVAPAFSTDAGYTPTDQKLANQAGNAAMVPPPAPPQNAVQAGPTAQMPPQAGPQGQAPAAGAAPAPPETQMRLDPMAVQQFRQGLSQRLGQYGPLTRQFFGARGLDENAIRTLAGLGPLTPELEQKLMGLGSVDMPEYASGTETPDFKMNAMLLEAEKAKEVQGLRNQGRGGQGPDDYKTTLASFDKAIATASGQFGGVLQPEEVARTKAERDAFLMGVLGREMQFGSPGEEAAFSLGARFKGQKNSAPANPGAPPPAGGGAPPEQDRPATMQDLDALLNVPRMPGPLKKKLMAAVQKGISVQQLSGLDDVRPYLKTRK